EILLKMNLPDHRSVLTDPEDQAKMEMETPRSSRGIPQDNIDDKGYWDSGCSRHMTGNISYLSEYETYNGGYVSFGHRGVIGYCKDTMKDGETGDFKLVDDTHVLLRTPRQQNMNNLVKGLPSKSFENNHTCVACLKGKQHKASCKSKLVNSVSKPLHTLQMDLFGPTSVSSLIINGIKEDANQVMKENVSSLRLIALPNWIISNADVSQSSGNTNPTAITKVPTADQVEPVLSSTVETKVPTEEGIDYEEVFAPVARIEAIRLFLAYASYMGFTVYQMDVKSAFLYGTIDEEHLKLDDIIFGSSNPRLCREFEALMHDKFKMSAMGELNFFLGLQVLQKKDGIFLSQDKYVVDILKKFGYTDIRSANTPMDRENPWGKDGTGKDVELHLYRSMIGSLMYLTASRPDIMFVVYACARHQVTPKECHLHDVKRIFRYLKGHPKLGLWYPKESPFDLVAYSDSDYGGANQDRKSTTRGCQFLGRRLISWQCKKQTIVATSTTETKYVAAASGCGQVLWIQNQLLDYGYNFMNTKIYIDNNSAICLVKHTVYHSRTKHVDIRHDFIRDCYEKKLINVDHIHTDNNVADLLTKPFDVGRFQYLVKNTENLNYKIIKLNKELSDCETDLYNYKRGLSQVEARLVEFKVNETKFCKRIRVLERDVEIRDNKIESLKNELEELKKEKESIDHKLAGFGNASKDLNELLESQKSAKDKTSLGFNEYTIVPPPPAQVYSPPKNDLSWIGLPKFVNDTVIDYSRPTPSIDVQRDVSESVSFFEQRGSVGNVLSKPMISFVKETGCPSVFKVNNTEMSRKPTVKYAKMYRSQRPRGNQSYWNNQKSQQLGSDFVMIKKAYYVCGSFEHL
ncbi:putative ribonuclease H-like domain-containing protein, partial [Tanacetum coccineum]